MKIKLNKKKLKNLSKDQKTLPLDATVQVAGGTGIDADSSAFSNLICRIISKSNCSEAVCN
ncbi:hypothetical protein [Pseudoalteromonas denitrificans]|uniref:Uncharacterized protein n=1 Tax=Pseudoalteromonas denitrificans DSM 6059 TaxID=1123010 RepID=A0A1I1N5F8_9GAMM|nr:hypothetical protein [Pseudoalteromonas denitrificans]SFC92924.1 hypothetical protein SAMN02745724_02957 [Pseudoalteromonas denitrificans DSM 6059]